MNLVMSEKPVFPPKRGFFYLLFRSSLRQASSSFSASFIALEKSIPERLKRGQLTVFKFALAPSLWENFEFEFHDSVHKLRIFRLGLDLLG